MEEKENQFDYVASIGGGFQVIDGQSIIDDIDEANVRRIRKDHKEDVDKVIVEYFKEQQKFRKKLLDEQRKKRSGK